ncbi:PAS domain-containing protein [Priestia megaterium]|nr:PAS domain-containing protein [Priestia megaterium]
MSINKLPNEWFEEILNAATEWIVVVDCQGIILYINLAYCEFLNTTVEDAIGKPVQEVIENTRMHLVVKTERAEVASIHFIKGNEMIANRYPLYVNDKLVGAVGTVMFRNSQDWLDYSQKIQPLLEELKYYKRRFETEFGSKYTFGDLIGNNRTFLEAKRLAERVSGSKSAVLLLGESGTGKELFAHAIHQTSLRAPFPFVRVNCASIPEQLLESELFGYEEGAFTGAKRGGKKGKFELAHRGTIFLDEVGDMPLHMQSKLLRAVQEKEVERVGGQKPISIDVRIIAATHRNLESMVQKGEFREDLYYRLNVVKIEIPPLRERKEDILDIAKILLQKMERHFNRQDIELSFDVIERLQKHSWPGNVRELENVLERAVNVLDGNIICLPHLPLYLRDNEHNFAYSSTAHDKQQANVSEESIPSLKEAVADAERKALLKALQRTNGNKQLAASLLEIGKTSFYDKCKLYGIR